MASAAQSGVDQIQKTYAHAPVSAAVPAAQNVVPRAMSEGTVENKNVENKNVESNETASFDRLSKELAKSEDKSNVSSHMKNINEADAQEILRLRDQSLKDHKTISELKIQEERLKAEALKNEYEQLKSRYDNFDRPADRVVNTQGQSGARSLDYPVQHFETASLAAPHAGVSGGRISAGGSSVAGAGTIQELSGAGSKDAVGSKEVSVQKEINDARLGMNLVVVASNGSTNKDHTSEDPNLALINYLNKNETTVTQLQALKESGLLYTEEDHSVDGKKVQKKKLIKFSELSPEAKILIEKKLASIKVQEVKRNYSRQALMFELFYISSKKAPLSEKKTSSLKF